MASLFRAGRHRWNGRRRRWLAASAAGVLAGVTAVALSMAPATATASPSYHPGLDTATFSVLGVTDANCFLGTGGNEIWIKPGDKIDFESSLVGLDVNHTQLRGLLTTTLRDVLGLLGVKVTDFKVAGLHVDATIDRGTAAEQDFTVDSTGTTRFPGSKQQPLKAGNHSLDWSVDSITLLPILKKLLGTATGKLTTLSLADAVKTSGVKLAAGAKLNWHGTIHVTETANTCALPAVSLPGVQVNAGKSTVSAPQVNVDPTASTTPPISIETPAGSAPSTGAHSPGTTAPGTAGPSSGDSSSSTASGAGTNGGGSTGSGGTSGGDGGSGTAQPDTGGAGAGGFGNALPDTGGRIVLGHSTHGGAGTGTGSVPNGAAPSEHLAAAKHGQQNSSANLAADLPTPQRVPVLLAILAIIALALVTATYARLYLLRRG